MKGAYYNEIDPYAAQWLRNLIDAHRIAPGDVDTRSIEDVKPDDLRPYTQCHFFAGIAGWSRALRLANWPDDVPVWTGSCPCQPFSASGKRAGFADERHLWPAWFHLIRECHPGIIFGEQVATVAAAEWLDLVCDDLEASGYAIGAADLPACSVGAPHKRDRLWWVANSIENGFDRSWLPKDGATGLPLPTGCSDSFAWDAVPVPANAKDNRRVLLLPDGVPPELERIGAYGNAIVPQVAAEFISAVMDCMP